jgi:hypothetical protein
MAVLARNGIGSARVGAGDAPVQLMTEGVPGPGAWGRVA